MDKNLHRIILRKLLTEHDCLIVDTIRAGRVGTTALKDSMSYRNYWNSGHCCQSSYSMDSLHSILYTKVSAICVQIYKHYVYKCIIIYISDGSHTKLNLSLNYC